MAGNGGARDRPRCRLQTPDGPTVRRRRRRGRWRRVFALCRRITVRSVHEADEAAPDSEAVGTAGGERTCRRKGFKKSFRRPVGRRRRPAVPNEEVERAEVAVADRGQPKNSCAVRNVLKYGQLSRVRIYPDPATENSQIAAPRTPFSQIPPQGRSATAHPRAARVCRAALEQPNSLFLFRSCPLARPLRPCRRAVGPGLRPDDNRQKRHSANASNPELLTCCPIIRLFVMRLTRAPGHA